MPRARETAVGESLALTEVVARQNHVAEQSARLALAGDVGGPAEAIIGVELVHVLQRIPRAVHRPEVQVADALDVVRGVFVEPALPEPAAQIAERRMNPFPVALITAWKGLVAEIHGPWAGRKRSRNGPCLNRRSERLFVFALALEHLIRIRRVQEIPEVTRAHQPVLGPLVIRAR